MRAAGSPIVEGARVASNNEPVAPVLITATSWMLSPPASVDPITVSALIPLLAPCSATLNRSRSARPGRSAAPGPPLTVWFSAAWHLTSGKGGIFATELQREMQLGSTRLPWAMLHQYRSVMVLPGRDRLTGDVEVDEAFLGGPETGIPGRGALGKVLFAAAGELNSPRSFLAALGWASSRTPAPGVCSGPCSTTSSPAAPS